MAEDLQPKILAPSTLPLELFDVSDGLSQGYVFRMTIDPHGYLWLGTLDGLL